MTTSIFSFNGQHLASFGVAMPRPFALESAATSGTSAALSSSRDYCAWNKNESLRLRHDRAHSMDWLEKMEA